MSGLRLRLELLGHGWLSATSLSAAMLAASCSPSDSNSPKVTGGGAGSGAAGSSAGGATTGASGSTSATAGASGTGVGSSGGSGGSSGSAGSAGSGQGGASGSAGTDGGRGAGGARDSSVDSMSDVSSDASGAGGSSDAGTASDQESGALDTPVATDSVIVGCDAGNATCKDASNDADGGVVDKCPTDPMKTDPGICGCNVAEPPVLDAGDASCLKGLLAHRYSFDGTGTVATDSISSANGAIMGGSHATLSSGTLSLSGDLGTGYTTEGYVKLPPRILDGMTSVTFEVWVTWKGVGAQGNRVWQRIFDFGDQLSSGTTQVGNTYLFLTPYATSSGIFRVAYSTNGGAGETVLDAPSAFPTGSRQHVAVVIDGAGPTMLLYVNGASAATVHLPGPLSTIDNANSWLGRSGFSADPEFNGIFDEFRIYKVPLTAAQIQASYVAGPNPSFF